MSLTHAFLSQPWRRMMLILTLMVALAGQIIPQGVMPTMAGDGLLRITICSDSSLATRDMVLTESGQFIPADVHDAGDDGDPNGKACPFAVASLALPNDTSAHVAAYQLLGLAPIAPRFSVRAMGAAAPLPPATGPPALS